MLRLPRIVLPGFPHHFTERGNRRARPFLDAEDHEFFLHLLSQYSRRHDLELWSYCLMPNHYHNVGQPHSKRGLSACFHALDGCYATFFNSKYRLNGHLWQERFFGCTLDAAHLWNAVRYVENNSKEAGLAVQAEDYRWSSAAAHCDLRADSVLTPDTGFPPPGLISDWSTWLQTGLTKEETVRLRHATQRGLPCGSETFIRQIEAMLGIRLRPLKLGPKKR